MVLSRIVTLRGASRQIEYDQGWLARAVAGALDEIALDQGRSGEVLAVRGGAVGQVDAEAVGGLEDAVSRW